MSNPTNIYADHTVAEMAALYLRFFSSVTGGLWQLASNAPTELRLFMARLPAGQLHSMVPVALNLIVQGKKRPAPPDRDTLLDWVLNFPDADKRIDALLAGRNPPTTFLALLERIYTTEYNATYEALIAFLHTEVARWN